MTGLSIPWYIWFIKPKTYLRGSVMTFNIYANTDSRYPSLLFCPALGKDANLIGNLI